MGGELASAYAAKWLGVHGWGDMAPQALAAIVAGRYAAQLGLALFGVYAILQAPLSSIGLRLARVAGLALGIAGGVATSFIVTLLVRYLGLQSSYDLQYERYILSHATGLIAVALFLSFIIFAPIVEEIVFRGILLQGLVNVTNGIVAVILSAAIFAGVHWAGGVAQVTSAFILGLVLGWLYLRARSIVPSAVAHIIYNAVAFYPLILYIVLAKH
jgi:membrane protease YdiL (CAAX protease family)